MYAFVAMVKISSRGSVSLDQGDSYDHYIAEMSESPRRWSLLLPHNHRLYDKRGACGSASHVYAVRFVEQIAHVTIRRYRRRRQSHGTLTAYDFSVVINKGA